MGIIILYDHICKYLAPKFDDFTEHHDHGPAVSKYAGYTTNDWRVPTWVYTVGLLQF